MPVGKEELNKAIMDIQPLVADIDEPFKTAAVIVLLNKRLEERVIPVPRGADALAKGKVLSISELLKQFKPSSYTETALAVGYYFENVLKTRSFTIPNLSAGFRDAKEPLPTNMNDVVNRCVSNGWFMKTNSKDSNTAWTLTRTGEDVVITRLGEGV
jgi:hypothetical protein